MKDVWLTFSRLDRTISVMGLCFSLCLSTSICMWAISLAWAKAIRASVCNLACLAKKSASSIGAEFEPVSSLKGGRLSTWGLIGICCFCGCFELSEVGVDPGDESVSEHGDSVSEGVSFMKQIWRFIPERKEWSSLMMIKAKSKTTRFKKISFCNCIKKPIDHQSTIKTDSKKKAIQIYFVAPSNEKRIKKDEQNKNTSQRSTIVRFNLSIIESFMVHCTTICNHRSIRNRVESSSNDSSRKEKFPLYLLNLKLKITHSLRYNFIPPRNKLQEKRNMKLISLSIDNFSLVNRRLHFSKDKRLNGNFIHEGGIWRDRGKSGGKSSEWYRPLWSRDWRLGFLPRSARKSSASGPMANLLRISSRSFRRCEQTEKSEVWSSLVTRQRKGEGVETPSMSLIFFPFLPTPAPLLPKTVDSVHSGVGVRQLMRLTTSYVFA